ncbi:MAG TPA: dicarboxylate/amino acid:cation symporter [Thermoanaerobaculales bacterium]|nr:dicarboxylate/amino acid:cation symporter [Thermoanaerobaculales bacterium]HPA80050.1 dicarboxylate/amino acid:cation symporter [Thermoanaerobaculales bacterium]HQL30399.1 dicarboxylate/amino acid:cation symporter [Thermoanaerobaculales bacterium]HQN95840.1 dicarboxylate/amino acid:cation symporter [Thermoanaerobaculales bacterium]
MRMALHTRMLLGGVIGAAGGVLAHVALRDTPLLNAVVHYVTNPIGQLFLRLLFMLVIPLIFSALVMGVAGLGDLRRLGRIGLKTLAYTVAVSSIAVLLGVTLVNVMRPGDGLPPEQRAALTEAAAERSTTLSATAAPRTGIEFLVRLVPDNPLRAAVEGDMLAVMVFSLLVGIGLTLTATDAARRLLDVVEGLYDLTMTLIQLVISVAPIGVAALLFTMTAQLGYSVLIQLARYVGVVLLGLILHQVVVYSLSVRLLGGMSPLQFFRSISDAMLTAFSTSSSSATLPTALKVAEEELRLPPHISRFVLTVGSTANQNGTALFEGVTVLFLAQLYGVHLTLASQALVVALCILGGIGTAGVPAGSLPVVALILGMVGVPVEGIGLVLGVDRFLDMCRTTLNVSGDLAAAVVVARSESWTPASPD